MTIKVGDKVPEATLWRKTADGIGEVSTSDLFSGKKVVVFGLPGAFTPTCSAQHVPGFVQHADDIKAKGVDTIACVSVNDAFVMGAWGEAQNCGDKVTMLSDGNGDLTKAMGLELDLKGLGLGVRSTRYSMIVDDGVVKSLHVEDNPGGLDVSSAETVLKEL
jgi:peroxiredoxin